MGRKKAPKLMIVDAPEVNAFAYFSVFGPRVALTSGLVKKHMDGAFSQTDIRAIFAHEVAHIIGRHPIKNAFASSWVSISDIVSSGLIVGGSAILVASSTQKDENKTGYVFVGMLALLIGAVLKLLSKISSLISFHYQRTLEYEADLIGAEVVGRREMASMLSKAEKLNRVSKSPGKLFDQGRWTVPTTNRSWFERLFDTHPATQKRINRLLAKPKPQKKPDEKRVIESVASGCPNCGAEPPTGSGFCPFCGAGLKRRKGA